MEQLTHVLSELRRSQASDDSPGEVGKLNRELGALHSLNTDQSARLQVNHLLRKFQNYHSQSLRLRLRIFIKVQRELLRKKQEESAELDRKILDLADRISKKRAAQSASGQLYTNVAAVEPIPNMQNSGKSNADSLPNKQLLVTNNITSRSDITPDSNDQSRGHVASKRAQRPISELFRGQDDSKSQKEAKIRPQPNSQSSIFQYRNPPEDKSGSRPPPPSYHSAINGRRSLPGQPTRGKLVTNKSPGVYKLSAKICIKLKHCSVIC